MPEFKPSMPRPPGPPNEPIKKRVPCHMFHSPKGCNRGEGCMYTHDMNYKGRATPSMERYFRQHDRGNNRFNPNAPHNQVRPRREGEGYNNMMAPRPAMGQRPPVVMQPPPPPASLLVKREIQPVFSSNSDEEK